MKTINKTLLMLFMAVAVMGIYTSCKKTDDLPNNGQPRITYIRVTNPESSDSLLVAAGQGRLIAIIGENLQDAVEIWFNDQQALLTPTYITSTSILVSVPTKIPATITNKLRILFSTGAEIQYDFTVSISKPAVNRMVSEYVNTGDVATITGDYFYAPVIVTFTGGATAELVSIKDQEIQFRVPAGAQAGPITVKTNFGETRSNFWFRDNRNIFISGDPHEGWWGTYLVTNPGPNDPPKISGNYYRFKKQVKAWVWDAPEVAGGPANSMQTHSKKIPDAAILKPEDYNLKFEINTLKPYSSNRIVINVGLNAEDNNNYAWNPPYDSKGQWNTIVIPFDDIVKSYTVKPAINPNGYWSRILVFGAGDLDADMAFDNFRVVPKVDK
jgi:hypothetical protein